LEYLISYFDSYIQSYQDFVKYEEGILNTEKMNIKEIYEITHPNFYINMNDSQFRTKYSFTSILG